MKHLKPITTLGDYINGKFELPAEKSGTLSVINPGNLKDEVGVFDYSYDHVNHAVEAAKKAFPSWSTLPMEKRIEYFTKFCKAIETHLEELSTIISRETGKPLWESRQEAKALLGKIKITIDESLKLVQEQDLGNVQAGMTGRYRFKPKGVMLVVGPFNFPAHLPHGHYVPALLTGNTVIFKPSEKTPATGQLLAEMIHRTGFPPGVFNLVQGEREVGKRLAMSNVDGVLFTGSYEVGLKIKRETAGHYWKTVVLEMGGKNASIVLDDADLNKTLYENIMGAYLTTGQRCSATSRVIITEKISDAFIRRFHELSKGIKIGYAFDDDEPFMGPLISDAAKDNYLRFQGIAQREGGEMIMRGKALSLKHPGHYITPSIYLMKPSDKTSVYLSTELFGPSVGIVVVKNLEEAIHEANKTDYGLAVSVFTKNRDAYETVYAQTKTGIINWNRSTAGASSRLPFGGQGKSGNQHPTALFAPYYCTYPISSLEDHNDASKVHVPPGLPFKVS